MLKSNFNTWNRDNDEDETQVERVGIIIYA